MPRIKLPVEELAKAHLLITNDQHKRTFDLAQDRNVRITELYEEMLKHVEGVQALKVELEVEG